MLTVLALAALLQGAPPAPAATFVEDVRKLAGRENDERFAAIAAMLRERNIPFEVDEFPVAKPDPRDGRGRGRNIMVTLGAGGDEVVLGGHFDAVRLADGTLSHGAVDNAASSVILVHLAESLRSLPLGTRVRIVWFDMEESGLLGSQRYLATHPAASIRSMVNFDINGYGDTVLFAAAPGADGSRVVRALVETCAAAPIDCVRFTQFPNSDDRSFGKAGVATVSVAMLPALEVHQLWLMMHGERSSGLAPGFAPPIFRVIHTAGDTIDKVDGASMGWMHRLAVALVQRLAASR